MSCVFFPILNSSICHYFVLKLSIVYYWSMRHLHVLQPATHSVAPVEGLQLLGTLEQTLQSSSNQLTKGLAEGFPVPLQPGPLVEFVPAFMRRVWPWRCPLACTPLVLLPGGSTWDENVTLFSSDSCTVLFSKGLRPPQLSFWDTERERLFSPQFWVSFTAISVERGAGLRLFPNSTLVTASAGETALLGAQAGMSQSVSLAGEHLNGLAVFPSSVRRHLWGPSLFRSPPPAFTPLGSHAWKEGMIGTDRARREGGKKAVPLSRCVQVTSVQPFLPGKWQSEVLLRRALTFPFGASHLQAQQKRKKWRLRLILNVIFWIFLYS